VFTYTNQKTMNKPVIDTKTTTFKVVNVPIRVDQHEWLSKNERTISEGVRKAVNEYITRQTAWEKP
jgi:hypothetical protein